MNLNLEFDYTIFDEKEYMLLIQRIPNITEKIMNIMKVQNELLEPDFIAKKLNTNSRYIYYIF